MEAYLDNSATTRCSKRAADKMMQMLRIDYGNPSAMHMKGVEAENYVKEAREKIAKTLKVTPKEIIFTSGGTESNNLAIIGTAMANKRSGMHIITTPMEHASVANPMKFLEEGGFQVTYLSVDSQGQISLQELQDAITEETILVSMMYVNNEVGAVLPIEAAGNCIKAKNPNTLFHVDAIQAYGKFMIAPKRCKIDLLSVSGHKIHGPKGTGFLYLKEKTKIKPIVFGGGQQDGLRSGTENVPGIAGLGEAAEESYENFQEKIAHLYELKDYLTDELLKLDGVQINGPRKEDGAPQIVNAAFEGVRSEVLLHSLEEKQVYVSAGSACSSNKPHVSATLQSIGVKTSLLDSSIRFSFSTETTKEEVAYAVSELAQILPILRKYTRKR